ncbi:prolyl 4-hydroxylase subunit alpha-2 family protein [Trichuris suis]|nr:prolyl 4-hydroxylase subunit alpha-2 family protein [Trichuris suis]
MDLLNFRRLATTMNLLCWCLLIVRLSKAEVFTAMADVENLIHTEQMVADVIERYVEMDTKRLEQLKKLAKEYRVSKTAELNRGSNHLYNPINAFRFIKKLTEEWNYVESLMKSDSSDSYLQNITAMRQSSAAKFPTDEDLTGAAVALLRLQDVYKLDTHELSQGKIEGIPNVDEFTAGECFELGRVAYNNKDYYHVILWMQEAMNRYEHEDPPTVDLSDILEYLAFGLYQQGNVKRALQLTKRLYNRQPDHPRAKGNIKYYEDMLVKDGVHRSGDFNLPPVVNPRPADHALPERTDFEALCRGEYLLTEKQRSTFYCYYKRDKPYLKLAPIKAEIVHRKPMILLFRDVISDREIDVLKTLAYPKLRRATVHNKETGELEFASYRISKSAWLKDSDHPVVAEIVRRIGDMTNLNMETAEELQIANYGLGGHYDPHFDHARVANYGLAGHYDPHFDMSLRNESNPYKHGEGNRIATALLYKEEVNAFKSLNTGNRIATLMFYISQPEAGGATVFTELKIGVSPTKRDAVFWHNLLRNGEGDVRTRHAACPVLAGVKWVANKWIHERGQEFYRPCALTENYYE